MTDFVRVHDTITKDFTLLNKTQIQCVISKGPGIAIIMNCGTVIETSEFDVCGFCDNVIVAFDANEEGQ